MSPAAVPRLAEPSVIVAPIVVDSHVSITVYNYKSTSLDMESTITKCAAASTAAALPALDNR